MRRALALIGLALLLAAPACKRKAEAPGDERAQRHPAIDFVQNGVAFHLTLPGWAPLGVDEETGAYSFARDDMRLLVQVRKFRRTPELPSDELAATQALEAFCVQSPCKVGLIKPGYYLSHYDLNEQGVAILNWDLAAFVGRDQLAVVLMKLYKGDEATHVALERALKESLFLELAAPEGVTAPAKP